MNQAGEGILIHFKQSGDSNSGRPTFVVTLFTQEFGVVTAMFKANKKDLPALQLGNIVSYTRYRRLENQMGTFSLEVLKTPASLCFHSLVGLQGIGYVCQLLHKTLRNEEPHSRLYAATMTFLAEIDAPNFWLRTAFYERTLLSAIGYGLSLEPHDAVRDGTSDDSALMYVSPRSGRAVSRQAGAPYKDKLLPLPYVFGGKSTDFLDVFALTGHFLSRAVPIGRLSARSALIELGQQNDFSDA